MQLNPKVIIRYYIGKGAFKYYVIKEVGGWVGQMMMFDDKVGGWVWLNDDVINKYMYKEKKTFVCGRRNQGCIFYAV